MELFKEKIAGINNVPENIKTFGDWGRRRNVHSDDEYDKYEDGDAARESVFEELKPVLVFSRLFGFTPFYVRKNSARYSLWYPFQNVFMVLVILYHMCVAGDATEGHTARSTLSLFFFKVIAICRNTYAMFILLHFMVKGRTCIEVWTQMEEINVILRGIHVDIDAHSHKLWNYLTTFIFLLVFAGFFLGYTATMSEPLSLGFCVLFFLPLFNNYLLIFYFSMLTTNLKMKCRLMNGLVREDIDLYNSRHESLYDQPKVFDLLEARRNSFLLLRKVRALKKMHLKMYRIVHRMNVIFGVHFIYIFVMYFCLGSLHCFTIIRHISSDHMSKALFFESVLTLSIESVHITFAVYGAIITNREMRRTIILVHKFLTMINEGDVNLENELQSFCMQLQQCGMDFTAWNLFSIDFTMLFQFTVAFFSNAVFFLQVDSMNTLRLGTTQ